jgi:uncharacterized protein (TIGR00369 family)
MPQAECFNPATEGWTLDPEGRFIARIGPIWRREFDGVFRFGLIIDDQHLNRDGWLHGGMTLALFDHALGIVASLASDAKRHVTVQLNTHFIGGGKAGDFVVMQSEVVTQTRTMLFMGGRMTAAGRLLATADGVWKKFHRP